MQNDDRCSYSRLLVSILQHKNRCGAKVFATNLLELRHHHIKAEDLPFTSPSDMHDICFAVEALLLEDEKEKAEAALELSTAVLDELIPKNHQLMSYTYSCHAKDLIHSRKVFDTLVSTKTIHENEQSGFCLQ